MEKKKITKYHIIVIVLIATIVCTIAWAAISIYNVKSKEQVTEEPVETTEEPVEKTETIDYEEPDMTLSEYEIALYEVETNNVDRYDISKFEEIIENNAKLKDGVKADFIEFNTSNIGFENQDFYDYISIWNPDEACVAIICKAKTNTVSPLTTWVRDFSETQKKKMLDDADKAVFKYYEDETYNGYRIILMCDNAPVIKDEIINYMQSVDEEVINKFTSQYTVTEHGAYKNEEETTEEK